MRLTSSLYRQHLGFMFKKHWLIQGQRTPYDTGAESVLRARGIEAVEANEFFRSPKHKPIKVEIVGVREKEIPEDETHPLWNNKRAYIYGDSNVVLEGVPQAQVLTKSVLINKLPSHMEENLSQTIVPENVDKSFQEAVLTSHVFDAQQEKLAIVKDPLRPAFVFPRTYGITDYRRTKLTISKLLMHCERMAGRTVTSSRIITNDAFFVFPYEKDGDFIQMEIQAETIMTSKKSIKELPIDANLNSIELPNLFPVKSTITIPTYNVYEKRDVYPISPESSFSNPHTIFLHYTPDVVKNLHETPVTDTQIESRNLLKAFTVAASRSRSIYGPDIKELPKPILVQSIQTDGKFFHFSIFQLNTLDLNGVDGINNVWYSLPRIDLFDECAYINARPYLGGYNEQVLKLMKVFYNNN